MQNLSDKLQQIDSLRREIESQGKLPDEVLRKIAYKFRLECNYHSNRIEGGTLTKPETRSVMVGNITVEGKPLKDIREMKGHDEIMLQVLRIGRGELRLSPTRIREIHRTVIVEEHPEKQKEVGEWKTANNHIINDRLERYDFAPHEEIPDKIQRLLNTLNAGIDQINSGKKGVPHPLLLAFRFHLDYLTIHPFMDGNGRTARLLTNLIVVSCGYPPFWVSEGGEKETYNRYLADIQGYGGDPDLLFGFLADLVLRSLILTSDAIQGKDIEETDGWLKELRLLKSSLSTDDQVKLSRSTITVSDIAVQSIKPCMAHLLEKLSEMDELFMEKEMYFGNETTTSKIKSLDDIHNILIQILQEPSSIKFTYRLKGFKKPAKKPFDISCQLLWRLHDFEYILYLNQKEDLPQISRFYHQYYTVENIAEISGQCGQFMVKQINDGLRN